MPLAGLDTPVVKSKMRRAVLEGCALDGGCEGGTLRDLDIVVGVSLQPREAERQVLRRRGGLRGSRRPLALSAEREPQVKRSSCGHRHRRGGGGSGTAGHRDCRHIGRIGMGRRGRCRQDRHGHRREHRQPTVAPGERANGSPAREEESREPQTPHPVSVGRVARARPPPPEVRTCRSSVPSARNRISQGIHQSRDPIDVGRCATTCSPLATSGSARTLEELGGSAREQSSVMLDSVGVIAIRGRELNEVQRDLAGPRSPPRRQAGCKRHWSGAASPRANLPGHPSVFGRQTSTPPLGWVWLTSFALRPRVPVGHNGKVLLCFSHWANGGLDQVSLVRCVVAAWVNRAGSR